MLHRFIVEALDITLRDLMQSDEPFGSKVIVCGGDFRQSTLPVVPRASRQQILDACLLASSFAASQVRPAFAMTVNKAQGQTLQRVGVYLPDPCFTSNIYTLPKTYIPCRIHIHPQTCIPSTEGAPHIADPWRGPLRSLKPSNRWLIVRPLCIRVQESA